MKQLVRAILIGLGAAGFILAALTVLFFNRSAFGWQALSVPTGSMRPTIQPGSLVLTHRVPLSSLKVGDVITHTNPLTMHTTITHRIVKEFKFHGNIPAFVTKGDANPSPDPMVVGGLVKGKAVWHVPYVGRMLMWSKTWTGIVLLVYLPALIIMVHETRLLAIYLRKMKPYRLEETQSDHQRREWVLLPKPALAASAMLAVVVAGGIGWQAAGALGSQASDSLLLVVSRSSITAIAPDKPGTSQQSQTECPPTANGSNVHPSTSVGQSADSGSAGSSGSTSGSPAKSGATSNTSSTNVQANTDSPPSCTASKQPASK